MTSDKEGFLKNIQKHMLEEKFDYIKIKNFSLAKSILKKVKRQATNLKKKKNTVT